MVVIVVALMIVLVLRVLVVVMVARLIFSQNIRSSLLRKSHYNSPRLHLQHRVWLSTVWL